MARDKKGKKGRGEETGEEVVAKEAHDTSSGRSRRKLKHEDERVDNSEEETDSLSSKKKEQRAHAEKGKKEDKASKQSRKGKNRIEIDSDEVEANETSGVQDRDSKKHDEDVKDAKRKKSSKKNKSEIKDETEEVSEKQTKQKCKSRDSNGSVIKPKSALSSDEDSEKSENKQQKKQEKTSGKLKNKEKVKVEAVASKFELLGIEGDSGDDANFSDSESKIETSESRTSSKKDDTKLESEGGKKSKKKERRKKKGDDDEDIDKILEELALEMTGQAPVDKPADDVKVEDEVHEVKKEKKEKKKGKKDTELKEVTEDQESVSQGVAEEEQRTVKTAAQKKKEKKEKERQKKIADYEQSSKKVSNAESKQKVKSDAVRVTPDKEEITEEKNEKEEDEAEDSKKKKKKKKGEEEKKEKKRPGKKQIAAMQEALKKVREEEERLRLEEEARIKAEEEAERLKQEKLQLEQERKEKKKQKEKEKRERLRAEGKLLSKAQRQNRARMEATLAALRQQGVEVPQIGEKKERAPRLGDRKRFPKKKNDTIQQSENKDEVADISAEGHEASPEIANELDVEKSPMEVEVEVKEEAEEEEEDDDVKDAWDESTDDDESEQSSKVDAKPSNKVSSSESTDESESEESEESETEESDSEESDDSEAESKRNEETIRERALERIKKRQEENENNRSTSKLRSPVVCVLGHVDTGKTKILDKIRRTHVQDSEAGGITQQIGATMVPQEALKDQCKMVKNFTDMELKVPGLLIIDTPGHESFSNLRSRGSSLCDIAILVVDIMHGLEPQTIESINLLKQKKTPFIVALNKVDRLYEWKSFKNKDIQDVIKLQARNTKMEFDARAKEVILQFATQGLNAVLYYDNSDPRSYISMVPTSAMTGDGMGNLMALVVQLTQQMMAKRLAFSEELQATVLEVKAIPGLGTTIDAILINGWLREGDTIVLAGYEGAVVTQIRSLLMPQPLKELRVKNPYQEYKEVQAAQGVKITGKDLDKAIAGLQLLVAHNPDEVPILKDEVVSSFREAMNLIKLAERGVYVQASTLGSLEALLDFLRTSKIPYAGIRIGPVVKKDVMKASIMLEHDSQYAVILAFDVKVEKDAQELADSLGVKIFQADIIYHLFDKFMAYREELKNKKRDEFKNVAVFPCKLRILPQYIFNSRDPIVVGVVVEAGVIKDGTPLCVPSKDFLDIGTVTTIEVNHKPIESARKGQEVCIKIEPVGGEAPKLYGRHFDHTDILVSKITRQSIDVCKEYFRDDLLKTDWQLMVELKKIFQIL